MLSTTEQEVLFQAKRLANKARWLDELASFPWCAICRCLMVRSGHDRNHVQRYKCPNCRATYGAFNPNRWLKRRRAVALFEQGYSVRQVVAVAGISKQTACTYRKSVRNIQCGCGQDVKHKGWCWWRFQRSPKRQAWMRQWRQDNPSIQD